MNGIFKVFIEINIESAFFFNSIACVFVMEKMGVQSDVFSDDDLTFGIHVLYCLYMRVF